MTPASSDPRLYPSPPPLLVCTRLSPNIFALPFLSLLVASHKEEFVRFRFTVASENVIFCFCMMRGRIREFCLLLFLLWSQGGGRGGKGYRVGTRRTIPAFTASLCLEPLSLLLACEAEAMNKDACRERGRALKIENYFLKQNTLFELSLDVEALDFFVHC